MADMTAQPVEVAPDDEALIANHRTAVFYLSKTTKDSPLALKVRLEGEVDASEEALRRRLAELRAEVIETERSLTYWEGRADKAEAALAACRDKTIAECAADILLQASDLDKDTPGGHGTYHYIEHTLLPSIHALKDKDPTNG